MIIPLKPHSHHLLHQHELLELVCPLNLQVKLWNAFRSNVASSYGVGKQKSVMNGDSGSPAKAEGKSGSPSVTHLISIFPVIKLTELFEPPIFSVVWTVSSKARRLARGMSSLKLGC